MRNLVIGGTRFLGRHLVGAALRRGQEITLFHRGQTPGLYPQAETILGNRDGGLGALANRSWDAVIDTCGYISRVVSASAQALADAAQHSDWNLLEAMFQVFRISTEVIADYSGFEYSQEDA